MSALKAWLTGPCATVIVAVGLAACAAPQAASPVAAAANSSRTSSQAATVSFGGPQPLSALDDLAGLQPADVLKILGRPDLRREESPASLWQYRAADCVLNLFFYRGADGDRLVRIETWQRNLDGATKPVPCSNHDAPLRARLVSLRASF
jgi:hypothetical protein